MTATKLRILTPNLTAGSIIYIELPSGDVVPVEDFRFHAEPTPDGTSRVTHLILMTEAEEVPE